MEEDKVADNDGSQNTSEKVTDSDQPGDDSVKPEPVKDHSDGSQTQGPTDGSQIEGQSDGSQIQGPQGISPATQPIARPYPQYSDGHRPFPHQGMVPPGYPQMQGMPYGSPPPPPHLQQFHPPQQNNPPGPQGSQPNQYSQNYPMMANQQGHMGNAPPARDTKSTSHVGPDGQPAPPSGF